MYSNKKDIHVLTLVQSIYALFLWLYWFNNLVNHLKFNNMRSIKFLMDSYFMQVG
jgi:hypothetical protein